jgi:hypothetical protein
MKGIGFQHVSMCSFHFLFLISTEELYGIVETKVALT